MKKLLVLVLIIIVAVLFLGVNNKPVFSKYDTSSYYIYLNSASSNADRLKLNSVYGTFFKNNIKGESAVLYGVTVDEVLSDFNAKTVKKEVVGEITSYYAYSDRIKYCTAIDGYAVNLHIAVKENTVTAGSPIIFGSF